MDRDLAFREATASDVPQIRDVAHDCWEHDYPGVVSRETIRAGIAEWYDSDRMGAEIDSDDALLIVCVDETDDVVGFAHATWEEEFGDVLRLYVHPSHRGEGVGSDLLATVVDELAAGGAETIHAMVLDANEPGKAFYRSAGFERIGENETTIASESYPEAVFEKRV